MRTLLPLLCVLALAAGVAIADDAEKKPESKKAPNPVVIMKIKGFGTVEIELYPDAAPKTVKNFIELAEGKKEWTHPVSKEKSKKPFFDGLKFHRVIKDFMLQGGDPLGNGGGGPGYFFEDEINAKGLGLDKIKAVKGGAPHPNLLIRNRMEWQQKVLIPLLKDMKIGLQDIEAQKSKQDEIMKRIEAMTLMEAYELSGYKFNDKLKPFGMKREYIAMANSGPNTNGSQFFINVKDNDYLTGKHTVFGKVIKGMDIVDTISKVKTTGPPKDAPITDIVIDFVRVKK